MTMRKQPQERQKQRMQATIEMAFQSLLREKSYESLTVGDITERANIGRSTFYRYFETKTDVLIAMHEKMFTQLKLGMTTRAEWLSDSAPAQLVTFLTQVKRMDTRNPAYYTLSKDLSYSREMTLILRRITLILSHQIEDGLQQAFQNTPSKMPIAIVAQSVVGIYTALFSWWLTAPAELSAEQSATYIHRLVRAIVKEAFLL
jgi:AcrR family transcriptional regulator